MRRLVDRGHEVRILGDPTLEDQTHAAGASFAAWDRAPHRTSADPSEDVVKDWEVTNPLTGLQRMRDRLPLPTGRRERSSPFRGLVG